MRVTKKPILPGLPSGRMGCLLFQRFSYGRDLPVSAAVRTATAVRTTAAAVEATAACDATSACRVAVESATHRYMRVAAAEAAAVDGSASCISGSVAHVAVTLPTVAVTVPAVSVPFRPRASRSRYRASRSRCRYRASRNQGGPSIPGVHSNRRGTTGLLR